MATRAQIDAIVTKIQGSRDLSPGGIAALKEVLYLLNDDIEEVHSGALIVYQASADLPNALVASGDGITITPNGNPGEVVFSL